MSEEEGESRGKRGRGGRPEGSGPRQAEARAIAEAVGREIGANLDTSLKATTTSLVDAFRNLLNSDALLAGRDAADPLQKVDGLIAEFSNRLSGLETILGRLVASGQHDAAVAVQRADDLCHIVEALRVELSGKRAQEQDAYRRFQEMHGELIQKIDCVVPAVTSHGASAALAALMPVLNDMARESSLVAEFGKLAEEQGRQHAEVLGTLKQLQRTPSPTLDFGAIQRRAIELALANSKDVRHHTKLETHPAEYVVERHLLCNGVVVETMADGRRRVCFGQWKVTQTAAGWSHSKFSEIAERATAIVADFQRKQAKPKLAVVA